MDKRKWYLVVCSVDLWDNLNFTDIYDPESEFISIFRLLRRWSLAECGVKSIKCIILPLNHLNVYKVIVDD